MRKNGPFRGNVPKSTKRGGDSIGSSNLDSRPPKLKSYRQARLDNELKAELYGDTAKANRSKVTLPKFSWDKE